MTSSMHHPSASRKANYDTDALTIGRFAKRVGLSVDTVRFYETRGLLSPSRRSSGGYRLYGKAAMRRVGFIKHARQCGMHLSEIQHLLELKADRGACCNDIRSIALRKQQELEKRIDAMQQMSQALGRLIASCTKDVQPVDECPILNALESSCADGGLPT